MNQSPKKLLPPQTKVKDFQESSLPTEQALTCHSLSRLHSSKLQLTLCKLAAANPFEVLYLRLFCCLNMPIALLFCVSDS
jgi:hypothetical protein